MNAIKESFDNLPAAICIFSSKGLVRLMNRRMLTVGSWLLGSGIQTLGELQAVLKKSPGSRHERCLHARRLSLPGQKRAALFGA